MADSRRAFRELEAEVLATLWRSTEPLTPGQVRSELGAELAYTTVMTILGRLHGKGMIQRERVGRAYRYSPAVDEAELVAQRMQSVLSRGSDREAVLARFVGTLSEADSRLISSMLRRRRPRRVAP